MPYLVDTDHLIDLFEGIPASGVLLRRLRTDGLAISVISYMEALEGLIVAGSLASAIATAQSHLSAIPILPVSDAVAERGAEIRAFLRNRRRRVESRAFDLVIAATALAHGLTLVTRNIRDYRDIPGLSLYAGT